MVMVPDFRLFAEASVNHEGADGCEFNGPSFQSELFRHAFHKSSYSEFGGIIWNHVGVAF